MAAPMSADAIFDRFAQLNSWPAPAKLNLCLYVVGKRENGYHELETLFQLLDFGDQVHFELNGTGEIKRAYDFGFSEDVDLCVRAAKLLKTYAGQEQGVTINLTKNLPMGGGLGGGSSDAATVLLALNQLWDTRLPIDELALLGLQLGADVPLFVHGRTAWGSGIGEDLEPFTLADQTWLVINPQINVSTSEIFANKRLTAHPQMKKIRALKMALQETADLSALAEAENQLEPIVRAEFPEVEGIFEWLSSQAKLGQDSQVRLSGSGGAVFMPVADRQSGARLLENRPKNCTGFVAQSVNFHPLYKT